MFNTCIASTISLRTRAGSSFPFSTNDYSHCSNETHPFFCSSQKPCCYCCCCCCSNSTCKVPLTPNYCYQLYGSRQSSLIQWSSHRRLNIRGDFDRCSYAGLQVNDLGRNCYCDPICNFRERSVGRRKGGFRRRMVFDEMSERYDMGSSNEVEIMLSLLTEDIDEDECFHVETEKNRRLLKKPVVEKNGNKFEGKKKIVDVGVVESGFKCETKSIGNFRKKDNRREDIIWRGEKKEALLREETRKDHRDAMENRLVRGKEEAEASSRKLSRKADVEQERESVLRNENWKVKSRAEEREDLSRRDGSSCSSYYSFSSTGDHECERENELKEGILIGDSSGAHMKNSNVEIIDENARENDLRHETFREDRGMNFTKKSMEKEFYMGSSAVESNFRKKSEKKLTDILSVEEMELSKKASLKDSDFSRVHENNYEKVSDHYNDHRKIKLSESTKVDEDLRQSETRLKYKQFVGMQDTHSDDVRNSYVSQNLYSDKAEMTGKVANQEKVEERQAAVGVGTRQDKYERDSSQVSEVLEIQELDNRKTSISQQRMETSVKEEDYSTSVLTSANVAVKQQQDDRVSSLKETRETSQNLTDKNVKPILKRESDKFIKEDGRLNLAYGPCLESKQTRSEIIKRVNSRKELDELITHTGNSGAIYVENRNKTKSETPLKPATYGVGEGSLQFDSSEIHEHNEEVPLSFPKFISQEDAVGSAVRLEKSSAHYIGDFVNQLRSEISSSEIQTELKTYETESVHVEQRREKNLLQHNSGDPHSEEHDVKKHDDQPCGSKGPTDEMWKLDEPSVQKLPKPDIQENASKPENSIVKRDGKSLWNIFSDIFRLRWSPRSESHSSDRKTGARNSPNLSTSSETWFSGHEAEENEGTSITHGVSSRHQEEKMHSLIGEGSSSNIPSSVVVETSRGEVSEGSSGGTSSAAIIDPLITIPALRLRRFSAMPVFSETGKENQPESGVSMEQTESPVNEGEVKRKKLQRKDHVVKDRFDEWEEAYILEAEQRKIDEMFMREALLEAKKAADNWEVPVGAVLVHNRKIIARGCNLVEELRDSTAHAEIICIREGSNVLRTWRLSETTLYITLEPCAMCAGAILQARIDTVVWGAPNKLLGADGSWIRLFPSGDGENNNNGLEQQSDKPAAPIHPFHPKIVVRRRVLASECADTMQHFFKLRRKKDKKPETPSSPPSCLPISQRPSKFLAKMHGAFSLMFCL